MTKKRKTEAPPEEAEEEIEELEQDAEVTEPEAAPPITEPDPPKEPEKLEGVEAAAAQAAAVLAADRKLVAETGVGRLDSATAASLQKQVDWEKDAKNFFRDEDHAKHRRDEMLAAMDKHDLEQRKEQEKLMAEARRKQAIADADRLEKEAQDRIDEANRLKHEAASLRAS